MSSARIEDTKKTRGPRNYSWKSFVYMQTTMSGGGGDKNASHDRDSGMGESEPPPSDVGHDDEVTTASNNGTTGDAGKASEDDLRTVVDEQLTRIGSGGPWVWKLFFLCAAPNILNGFHVASYVFLGKLPTSYWCDISDLLNANWTSNQMRSISSTVPSGLGTGCSILNYDYNYLSSMSYEAAIEAVRSRPRPPDVSCLRTEGVIMHYEIEGSSIVPEWDLVCENSFWRTTVQVAVSFGKFVGASVFGIISDKFGRKNSFTLGAAFYVTGSLLTTFSPWYWPFLVGRVLLGSASSGLFYPALTILTENIGNVHRSWMSIAFTMSYPIGMMLLAISAHFIHTWRELQLSLTIPTVFLLLLWCFMTESPRWLLSKNRIEEAYGVVFKKKKKDIEFPQKFHQCIKAAPEREVRGSCGQKFKNIFKELTTLYGPSKQRRMACICHYTFCITSLSYYVTALNADNLAAEKTVYIAATGCIDILGYITSIIFLRYMGRKLSSCLLFGLSGCCMLLLLALPLDANNWIVFLAMFGRFGVSSVYSIVTLHTAELFPTEIRGSALGACSTMAHVGSMAAPFVVDFLGKLAWFIPTTICGVAVFLAAILTMTLPETRQRKLEDHCQ